MEGICKRCSQPIPLDRKRAVFCSKNCKNRHYSLQAPASQSLRGKVASGTVGAVQELRVSVDLLLRGYEVFRALSPSSSCDLAATKDGKFLKIEVTTGYISVSGKVLAPKKLDREFDVLAVVMHDGCIVYDPDIFGSNGERSILKVPKESSCKKCGLAFKPTTSQQVFCSKGCRRGNEKEQGRKRKGEHILLTHSPN